MMAEGIHLSLNPKFWLRLEFMFYIISYKNGKLFIYFNLYFQTYKRIISKDCYKHDVNTGSFRFPLPLE